MEVINALNLAAAVNCCALAIEAKVPLDVAVITSSQAITYVVTSQYGSQIVNSTPLKPEQIVNGSIVQTVFAVKQGCYQKLTDKDQKFIDTIISQAEKQIKEQSQKKP